MQTINLDRLKESAKPMQVTTFLGDTDIRIEQMTEPTVYMAYIGNYSQEHADYESALTFIVNTLNSKPHLIPEA